MNRPLAFEGEHWCLQSFIAWCRSSSSSSMAQHLPLLPLGVVHGRACSCTSSRTGWVSCLPLSPASSTQPSVCLCPVSTSDGISHLVLWPISIFPERSRDLTFRPLPQLPNGVLKHLICASSLAHKQTARKSDSLVVWIFGCIFFHQKMWVTDLLETDQKYCWMCMQPPFLDRLPDSQTGAELTGGSGSLWSGVLCDWCVFNGGNLHVFGWWSVWSCWTL